MIEHGFWRDETIIDAMRQALESCPDKIALVAYRSDTELPTRLKYRELDDLADRVARGLRARGVGRFDVVSFQLPNWWQFVVIALACAKLGAVANPLMSIFRERELEFMLNFGASKVLIVPKVYRGFDYEAMATTLVPTLDHQVELFVVDGTGDNRFDRLTETSSLPPLPPSPLNADDVLLVMYTSGTTGEPKGVMHTSNTLFANIRGFIERLELDADDVVLGASPMAHLTGYGYLAMAPLVLNATTVLQDVWEPHHALAIVRDQGVTFSMASSPFVADLCDAVQAGAQVSPSFAIFCCAGAPIPPVLIERAYTLLGLTVCSAWGMTENGAVTITEPSRALDKSGVSDGRSVPGMEIKVVDELGASVEAGITGRLLVRGASMFGGYLNRPEYNATDADGWFDTGDLAFIDAEGYVRINGRSKDIVIRGGENIPVVEVENLIYQHPAVTGCAIVGYPDARLGEKACVFVSLVPGSQLTLDDLRQHLTDHRVARPYHPERIEIVDELPRTPSGKIQKFKLRDQL